MNALHEVPPSVRSLEDRADRELAMAQRLAAEKPKRPAPAAARGELSTVELLHAADLKPEPIRWLWPGWLARGKLHVLAGAPGTGKTTLAMDLAACVTSGRALPSGWKPERGHVLIWSGEDDPKDTLVPRLLAAHADVTRACFVGDVHGEDGPRPFDPARDVDRLAAACARIDSIALLIVDPLVSAVAGDSHRNAEVRRGLAPLVDLAVRLDAALLGITHYSKGTGGRDPLERISGSLAFGALARVVLGTVRQQGEDETERKLVLARAKSNIGPDGGGFTYAFEQVDSRRFPGVSASRIVWGAELQGTARELLAEPEPEADEEARDATHWLRELLATGPMPAKEVRNRGDEAGFAWRTLQRTMRRAGVESRRGGFGQPATWALAVSRATVAPVAPTLERGANGANGPEIGATDAGEIVL